jgi:hypothetical protein
VPLAMTSWSFLAHNFLNVGRAATRIQT